MATSGHFRGHLWSVFHGRGHTISRRSVSPGFTSIKGQLDDFGIEVLRKAINALSASKPEVNGVRDLRSAANRRANGLIEALQCYLNSGAGPHHGLEPAHLTVVMQWDALDQLMTSATFDSGHPAPLSIVRRLLCDAKLLPALVLGSDGQVFVPRSEPADISGAHSQGDHHGFPI